MNDPILDIDTLDTQVTDITNKVIQESDISNTQDLIALFNWNISKKNVARVFKLNKLLDHVTDQMLFRFEQRSDQFSNDDLLNYMKVVSSTIETSNKSIENTQPPPEIVNNNTQITVNVMNQFDRDSRERILAAVQATLKDLNKQEPQDTAPIELDDKEFSEVHNSDESN